MTAWDHLVALTSKVPYARDRPHGDPLRMAQDWVAGRRYLENIGYDHAEPRERNKQMIALDHLRAVLEAHPVFGGCSHCAEYSCAHCGADDGHAPDCPWVAAKAFVEREDEALKQIEAMKPWFANREACDPDFSAIENITLTIGPPYTKGETIIFRRDPKGFTVPELLVVIAIILIVSAVVLPLVLPALSHRQASEGARILQAQLAGARDAAIRDNAPRGIRLIPDLAFTGVNPATGLVDPRMPLAASRIIPIGSAPDYREGRVTPWPAGALPPAVGALPYQGPGTPANPNPTWGNLALTNTNGSTPGGPLMAYESVAGSDGLPNNPTSWFWNIRVGDQIQINNAGPWYTVVGPMVVPPQGATIMVGGMPTFFANTELFVNVGPPGTLSPFIDTTGNRPEFLLLVNGQDDNQNGWKDEGWDGVDNDGRNGVDDAGEWELESWLGALGNS
jgi:prepilin-type N-terminal cleavage/methylation domain-containing protein